ncbi:MAG: cohesin domain-containing protein [Desulfuromonadaceae bacterium]|nr:cohesin domain-containing protein [Desulfuromonadaceae bacterium]MDD5106161.1 cohesin domain-containing protein [Desulfuromonadaceae bacterium]
MRYLNLISHSSLILLLFLLSACASTATRQFKTAESLEEEGKYEEAMYSYADSFKSDPTSSEARIRFFNTRVKAAEAHFKRGMILAKTGNHADALQEFTAAQGIDPTQERFNQQIEISTRFKNAQLAFQEGSDFEKGNKLKDAHRLYIKAAELFPDNAEYQAALERITKLRKSNLDSFELRLKSSKPITLKFKDAKMKDVFKIITQLSGINFIFDEGVKDSPVTIFLENATFHQALDLLSNMNKLNTKNLNESTVLLFMNTPDKSKQYEDMVLRTFHLNYMEAKKAINLIRTLIQVRKVYVNEDSNSIVVRDTEDVVNVVEKIIDANDMPEAEVVLDVEVIEVSDKNAENVGLLLSNYNVQMGMFSPENKLLATSLSGATATVAAGSTTVTTGGGDITNLVKAFNINNHGAYVTVPNATFNFGKTLAKGEVLSNPKIRVKNKEKSKFNVGTRVPITTTTLNGTVSQVNVQYVDVGVKVSAEPTIQLNNEISIKLNLEVSSILTKEKVGADGLTTVVTIGTRNIETVLSLKDNETSVIGGLIQRSDSSDKTKMYLLSDIPLIGQLFTNNNSSKDKTELMLAITPRLVRGVPVPLPGLASFASGKEDHPSLVRPLASFDLEPVFEGDTAQKTIEKKSAEKRTAAPSEPPIAKNNAVTTPVAGQSTPAPAALPPVGSLQRSLLQIVAPSSVTVGQQFVIDVMVSNVTNLANAPFVLTFDPAVIDFVAMSEGKLLKKDDKQTVFSQIVDPVKGTVTVSLARTVGDQGVSGSGTLVSASFKAKSRGSSRFAIMNQSFTTPQNTPLHVLPFSTAVDVK